MEITLTKELLIIGILLIIGMMILIKAKRKNVKVKNNGKKSKYQCKKCGSSMSLKTGYNKFGKPYQFYGCDQFSKGCNCIYNEQQGKYVYT